MCLCGRSWVGHEVCVRVIRWGDRSRSNRERGGKGPVMSCGQNGGSRPTKPGASYDGVHKSRWKTRHFASGLGNLEGLLNSACRACGLSADRLLLFSRLVPHPPRRTWTRTCPRPHYFFIEIIKVSARSALKVGYLPTHSLCRARRRALARTTLDRGREPPTRPGPRPAPTPTQSDPPARP